MKPGSADERAVLENPELCAQILEELNVKKIELIDDERTLVKSEVKADFKKLGPRAGKHLKAIRAALMSAATASG